jgi:hypothetical protein
MTGYKAALFSRIRAEAQEQDQRAAINKLQDLCDEISCAAVGIEMGEGPPNQRVLDSWASDLQMAFRLLGQL